MSWHGQSGASLGQSLTSPAALGRGWRFGCSFSTVPSVGCFQQVAMGRNRAAMTFGPFLAFSGKLLLKNIPPQPLVLPPPRVLCAQTDQLVKRL